VLYTYINRHPKGFEAEVFTGWMPFVLLNRQCQSSEGINQGTVRSIKEEPFSINTADFFRMLEATPVAKPSS